MTGAFMKKGFVLRIFYLASFLVLAFAAFVIYPHTGTNAVQQSKQSGDQNWKAPASAAKVKNPLAGNSSAEKAGKNLFDTYCTTCHGDNGKGDGPQAASLNVKPKNLTSKAVQEESDGALFWKISTGKQPMIAWKYTLSKKQRWQLVDYIRHFAKK